MLVSVIGCGHLGAAHAASMAEIGHEVIGVEVDAEKAGILASGRAWFHEEDLDDLLAKHTATGRLRFTTDVAEAAEAEVHFIGVGTPTGPDGRSYDMSQVHAAVRALAPYLTRRCLIIGKSTVTVGTTAEVTAQVQALAPAGEQVMVAWNPEFLREGFAVQDTLHPDRVVVGVADPAAEAVVRQVYGPILDAGAPIVITDPATTELVKGSANAYLAMKISFINAMADVCQASGADVSVLAAAIGADERIGPKGMYPGLGYGGGCLPKDIRAFGARAEDLGADHVVRLLATVDEINTSRRDRVIELVAQACGGQVAGHRVAVWGAAFKPGTDDVRDSPALDVAVRLQAAGADVVVYDPQALHTAKAEAPQLTYASGMEDAVAGAEAVVLATEWRQFADADPVALAELPAKRILVDARNVVDATRWRSAGWDVLRAGRP
jgi:UDPglucose 6-dehydrogenase